MIAREVAEKIIGFHGYQHQLYKSVEELAELGVLIIQDANVRGKVKTEEVLEEIADVYIMLSQLKVIYNLSDRDIEMAIDYKIDRTFERMKE